MRYVFANLFITTNKKKLQYSLQNKKMKRYKIWYNSIKNRSLKISGSVIQNFSNQIKKNRLFEVLNAQKKNIFIEKN